LSDAFQRAGLETVSSRQTKIPPGRPHGRKSLPQRAVMYAFDVLNVALTRAFNARGDRITLIGRRPAASGGEAKQAQGSPAGAR